MKTVGVFIEISDLYHKINRKYPGRKLNYLGYLEFIQTLGHTSRLFAYGVKNHNTSFIHCLKTYGFETKFKRPKVIKVKDKEIKTCDWGVQVTLDILTNLDDYDTVVLGSTNFDFIPLIKYLRGLGKEVIVFASSIPSNIARLTDFIEIPEEMVT